MLIKGLIMAKAKPIKQKKENKFLTKLKFFLKTLISNNACVDGRTHKWYWPVIIAVLSAVIATIPTLVGRYTTKASSIFTSGYKYDLENSLVKFNDETKNVKMEIKSGMLSVDLTAWDNVCKDPSGNQKDYWGYYYQVPTSITEKTEETNSTDSSSSSSSTGLSSLVNDKDKWYCGLAVYYSGATNAYSYATSKTSNVLNDPNYQLGHTVTSYSVNMIVIGNDSIYIAKGVSGSSTKGVVQVKYNHSSFEGKDLHDLITPIGDQTVIDAWSNFLENGYSSTRIILAWEYSGIMFAIAIGLNLIMGLLVFIMTRGKNNPFRIYTFWESQKIAYYASFSPAVLGLLSFIPMFSQMTMFLFPMMFILRITWMSMRSLRPQA